MITRIAAVLQVAPCFGVDARYCVRLPLQGFTAGGRHSLSIGAAAKALAETAAAQRAEQQANQKEKTKEKAAQKKAEKNMNAAEGQQRGGNRNSPDSGSEGSSAGTTSEDEAYAAPPPAKKAKRGFNAPRKAAEVVSPPKQRGGRPRRAPGK